ncbi:MAG: hypothetical protein ACREFX_03620 [Opitutaceae bacterium]
MRGARIGAAKTHSSLITLLGISRFALLITLFAVSEFDGAFGNRTILLVDRQAGRPLAPGEGPWRLVCPGDKRPARWARMVIELDVIGAAG